MSKIKVKPLLFWVLSAIGVGALSGVISMDAMKGYAGMDKPPLSPPAWLFPAVWTVLFLLMGISAYLIWADRCATDGEKFGALTIYCIQLIVNFFWPLIFFNAGAYLAALAWLILLIALVILTIVKFRRIRPAAGWMNLPYLMWLCFAAYLNAGVWWLNR